MCIDALTTTNVVTQLTIRVFSATKTACTTIQIILSVNALGASSGGAVETTSCESGGAGAAVDAIKVECGVSALSAGSIVAEETIAVELSTSIAITSF